MDYKALLMSYREHIINEEGVSFLEYVNRTDGGYSSSYSYKLLFTEQELDELKNLEQEVRNRV